MASKRKSTTPCMIPSKVIRPVDEADRDSPGLLRQSRLDPAGSPKQEVAGDVAKDGTYTCKPCDFETPDLNLFLDHVYSGHPEFRSDPSFCCVSCGFSAAKFEGLALHNARVHPSTMATTLQLRRRERRAVVEQCLAPGDEAAKDSEISITKTPIMRMLKGKSEAKRIVVSHPASDETPSEPSERKEPATVTVTHVPTIVHNGTTKVTLPSAIQIVNGSGALPMLKTPITQVVSVVQSRNLNQPIMASANISSTSFSTSKNLPKVMIPLSSIPTYSASMDSSSFLKTSFSKFPYPTKAELCYLTVVTKFPEEQIKIWFTAQRLKQGISWSPEEIEDARRKMFNTIIQTAPSGSQAQTNQNQHTITVLPASLGAAGIPHILQGSIVSQGGVIVTQPVVANGIQVNSAPVALAVTPKPQAAARPMMQARPAAALVADKGVSMVVGSSTGTAVISRRDTAGSVTASVINLSVTGANAKVSNGKPSNATSQANATNSNITSSVAQSDAKNAPDAKPGQDGGDKKNTSTDDELDAAGGDSPTFSLDDPSSPASKSSSPPPTGFPGSLNPSNPFLDPSFFRGKKSQEQLTALKDSFKATQFPDQEEVERLISLTGLTVREVRKWFSDRRYHYRHLKLKTARPAGVTAATTPGKSGAGSGSSNTPGGGSGNPVDLSESSSSSSGAKTPQQSSAPLSPTPSLTPTSPTTPSRRHHRAPSPDFTAIRYKERDPHQVKALEASFLQDPDPPGEEVDRLRTETKMTRREIHGWFSDRRKRVAAEKKKEEAERALREEEQQEEEEEAELEERQKDDGSGEPKVNPIKINLKMLKVTEANGGGGDAQEATPSSSASSVVKPKPSPSPKAATIRGKKTAEQLQTLKLIYARTQWPSAAQYDHMISSTGLPRPEVVRWFGDCRYVQKNGQLKWLEAYQNQALEEDLEKGHPKVLEEHYKVHGSLDEPQLQELSQACGLTTDLVKYWFSVKASQQTSTEPRPAEPGPAGPRSAEPGPAEPGPVEPKPTETRPAESRSAEPKPTETRLTEPRPAETRSAETGPREPKPTELQPTEPRLTEPKPTELKPAEPRSAETRPTEPRQTEPKPAKPRPAEPGPREPKLTELKPTELKPAEPNPTETRPAEPKPAEPRPAEPGLTEPRPAEPKPTEPRPVEPGLTKPRPAEPRPVELKPTESRPADPRSAEPQPTEPRPVEPRSAEARPTESGPIEPGPAKPRPAEPRPVEPRPVEPGPAESGVTEENVEENVEQSVCGVENLNPAGGSD